jgi:hypothetical protein
MSSASVLKVLADALAFVALSSFRTSEGSCPELRRRLASSHVAGVSKTDGRIDADG